MVVEERRRTRLIAAVVLVLMAGAVSTYADVHYVDADALGADNGTSWTNAFNALQGALTAAVSGDEIWVREGTYKPTSGTDRSISFALVNGVSLYGGFGGGETFRSQRNWAVHETILSGDIGVAGNSNDNSYHVVTSTSNDNSAVLDGFTVKEGNADGGDGFSDGGGMYTYFSFPTVTNCTFSSNNAHLGGGLGNRYSSPILVDCVFSRNDAQIYGGGLYNDNSSPKMTRCTFSNNHSSQGGGVYNNYQSFPRLMDSVFSANTAFYGGAICNHYGSVELTNCTLNGNMATTSGGAIYNHHSSPTLVNCTLNGNSASTGGGLYNYMNSFPAMTNCTLSGNSAATYGGGMLNFSSSRPTFVNCTFTENNAGRSGGGMHNYWSIRMGATIVSNNTAPEGPDIFGPVSSTMGYNLVGNPVDCTGLGLTSLTGMDPLLGPLAHNGGATRTHALLPGSPAIDAVPSEAFLTVSVDQRGVARPQGSACDIGAYEASPAVTLTVVIQGEGTGAIASEPAGIACGSTCSNAFGIGAAVNLTATPDPGSVFQGWAGDCQGATPMTTIIMEGDRTCIAVLGLPNVDPVACFTHTPDIPTTLDLVAFQDCSSDVDGDIVEWFWEFGDGDTAAERSPTHRFAAPGIYNVALTVVNSHEGTNAVTHEVVILAGGDVDGDGKTTVLDVRLILQSALGLVVLPSEQQEVADINNDGEIDMDDAATLAKYVIGARDSLP